MCRILSVLVIGISLIILLAGCQGVQLERLLRADRPLHDTPVLIGSGVTENRADEACLILTA